MTFRSKMQKLAYWTIPAGIYNNLINLNMQIQKVKKDESNYLLKVVQSNIIFKNIHKGKRCFIVCNGPSVNKQNLRLLKGEWVISVSNGYQHPDYSFFQPAYHCVPQLTYTAKLTDTVALNWFREMDRRIGPATLFLNITEYDFVQKHKLFLNRSVYYLNSNHPLSGSKRSIYDICSEVPLVQSVPIMSLMIAMYMGFEYIYLLGAEHDSIITKKYKYFYDNSQTILSNTIEAVADNGDILCSFSDDLLASANLWKLYITLKRIALENNISIVNATEGGVLDVFPRIKFDTLFK